MASQSELRPGSFAGRNSLGYFGFREIAENLKDVHLAVETKAQRVRGEFFAEVTKLGIDGPD